MSTPDLLAQRTTPMVLEIKLVPIDTEVVAMFPVGGVILPGVLNVQGRLAITVGRDTLDATPTQAWEPRRVRCLAEHYHLDDPSAWLPLGPVMFEGHVLYVFVEKTADPDAF